MIRFILVRHGNTLWNKLGKFQGRSDIALSDEGIIQGEKLAQNFPYDADIIYTSPLKRAWETGKFIKEKFNIPLYSDDRLTEIAFGLWEGKTYEEIKEISPKDIDLIFSKPTEAIIPEGESFIKVQKRGIDFILDKLEEFKGENKTIVVISHGGILRTILAYALNMSLDDIWRIRLDNTAISVITKFDEASPFVVEKVNSTNHLGS